ncbi:hypothetical protein AB1Y20_008767 [Prymnesium parvum]|uniref:Uncharacterized protein n=1 Tax=Prymnesium parvum TaxID=97485 RepID=A0AB34IUC6_PRYPA
MDVPELVASGRGYTFSHDTSAAPSQVDISGGAVAENGPSLSSMADFPLPIAALELFTFCLRLTELALGQQSP